MSIHSNDRATVKDAPGAITGVFAKAQSLVSLRGPSSNQHMTTSAPATLPVFLTVTGTLTFFKRRSTFAGVSSNVV